jgi:hypothetical protein
MKTVVLLDVTNIYYKFMHSVFQVRKQFVKYVHPYKQVAEMWLDYNGQALKW